VNCASAAPGGNYPLQITATSGTVSHTVNASLAVEAPTFTLQVSPSTLSLAAGAQGSFQVSLQPVFGFSGPVQVQISGLPGNGGTVTPGVSFPLTATSPQTVTLNTSTQLSAGSHPLTLTGTSGSITETATESLTIQNQSPSRADFVLTNDTPGGAAYDQLHQRVYVSNPAAGTVDVISSTSYQILRSIPVPSPQGIDISPDDSTVFIGSGSVSFPGSGPQAVYALDTASMALTARYLGPPFGSTEGQSYPGEPLNPIATPDGNVEISINGSIVKWYPSTGQVTTVLSNSPINLSASSPFDGTPIGVAAHSRDHSKVITSDNSYPSHVSLYDTNRNSFVSSATFQGATYSVAANPDGTQFAIWVFGNSSDIYLLDANLNTIATIPGGGNLLYSTDGSTLYVVGAVGNIPAVSLLNVSTQQWVGTAPSFAYAVPGQSTLNYEAPMVADETGRIFGRTPGGLVIDDTAQLRTLSSTANYPSGFGKAAPNDGPVGEQQTVTLGSAGSTPAVYFGPLAAQDTANQVFVTTTSPAYMQTGPVNILLDFSADGQFWIPQAYTYGAVLSPGPDLAASNAGGTAVNLYGYGLGYYPSNGSAGSASSTTASFGSHSGTVTSAMADVWGYGLWNFSLWDINAQAPSTPLGESDLTVSYETSSSTLSSAYHAVSINSYTLDGTAYSIAYDARRNQVYVAVTDHIDVFSLATNAFVSTIQIPAVNNLRQLGGISLTPDGNWLIAANWADGSVAVINPDSPASATAIAVGAENAINTSGEPVGPFQIAPTNNGEAFISISTIPLSLLTNTVSLKGSLTSAVTEPSLWLLNLQTMAVSGVSSTSQLAPGGTFMAASPDGSVICSTNPNNGPMTLYDVGSATAVIGPVSDNQGAVFCAANGGIAASASRNEYGAPIVSDMSMRTISQAGMTGYQYSDLISSGEPPLGIAVDSTGALSYVPWAQEIALFDAHTGEYRERIALPAALEQASGGSISAGPISIDQTGKQIFAVSQSGLTVIQLDSLPLAIGSIAASSGTWALAGTGFAPGTTLSVDGISESVTYTDEQHLTVLNAPALSAAHRITLTNPDGHSYTYDAAYFR
jgi:hypothetical protein